MTEESTSTGFPSGTFNIKSKYFGDQLKSLRSKNTNRIIIAPILRELQKKHSIKQFQRSKTIKELKIVLSFRTLEKLF